MKTDKMSISLPAELAKEIRAAAKSAGVPVSRWLAEAAEDRARRDALAEAMREWQAEFGEFTEAELEQARQDLGITGKKRRSPAA